MCLSFTAVSECSVRELGWQWPRIMFEVCRCLSVCVRVCVCMCVCVCVCVLFDTVSTTVDTVSNKMFGWYLIFFPILYTHASNESYQLYSGKTVLFIKNKSMYRLSQCTGMRVLVDSGWHEKRIVVNSTLLFLQCSSNKISKVVSMKPICYWLRCQGLQHCVSGTHRM